MDIGEVNDPIWLTYENSKPLHVIRKLLLLKMTYWLAITTKLKSKEDKLCEL